MPFLLVRPKLDPPGGRSIHLGPSLCIHDGTLLEQADRLLIQSVIFRSLAVGRIGYSNPAAIRNIML